MVNDLTGRWKFPSTSLLFLFDRIKNERRRMLDIFRKHTEVRNTTGIKAPYELHNINRMMKINEEKVLSYYRYKSRNVSTDDLIVRILKFLSIREDMDIYYIMELIDMSMGQLVRHFNLISTKSKGKETNDNYYIVEEDDELYFSTDWENFIPLRPVLTEYDSLLMDHPEKFTNVVYAIDIKLLAIQYFYFLRSPLSNGVGIQEFVYRYIYTNAIPNFNSLAMFNRLVNDTNNHYKNPHPFAIIDFNTSVYKIFKKYRHDIMRRTTLVKDIFLSIETTHGTLLDAVSLIFQTFNGNNIKPYLYIYGHYIEKILSLMNKSAKRYNRNQLSYYLTFYKYGITSRMDTYDITFMEKYTEEVEDLILFLKGKK